MRFDHVFSLVRAHYEGDQERFLAMLRLIASKVKDPRRREALLRLVKHSPEMRLLELAPDQRGLLDPLEPRDLSSLVLADEPLAALEQVAAEHDAREGFMAMAAGTLTPTTRMLFHGPPGNGKTTAAAALCGRIGKSPFGVSLARLISGYMGATGANLDKILGAMRAGHALVLDEVDAIGETRSDGGTAADRERNNTVNTLLTLLDRAPTSVEAGVLIATTNRVDLIDPALARRFEVVVEFPAPSSVQKAQLAERLASQFGVSVPDVRECKSFDDVERLVRRLARKAIVDAWQERREAG